MKIPWQEGMKEDRKKKSLFYHSTEYAFQSGHMNQIKWMAVNGVGNQKEEEISSATDDHCEQNRDEKKKAN